MGRGDNAGGVEWSSDGGGGGGGGDAGGREGDVVSGEG